MLYLSCGDKCQRYCNSRYPWLAEIRWFFTDDWAIFWLDIHLVILKRYLHLSNSILDKYQITKSRRVKGFSYIHDLYVNMYI